VTHNAVTDALAVFDFTEPNMVAGQRETTTVPAQAPYLLDRAASVVQPLMSVLRPPQPQRTACKVTCYPAWNLAGTVFPFTYNRLEQLEEIVQRHGSELAAVVMEPTRSTDPQPGFLEGVRELCDRCGATLVFDEISSGWRMHLGGVHLEEKKVPGTDNRFRFLTPFFSPANRGTSRIAIRPVRRMPIVWGKHL